MDESVLPAKSNASRLWAFCRWLMRSAIWISVFAYLFSFFGERFFVAELLANFRVHFFVLFLILLVVAGFAKPSKLILACLVVATLLTGWETGKVFLPAYQPTAGSRKVRIMSFNVLSTNIAFRSGIAEIKKHDPDIVAVIEYANMWHMACDALNESYPHQHRDPRWHGYGIAIFSKLPFESVESIPLTKEEIDNPAIVAKVSINGQVLRIMAVHVMSPIKRYRLELRNRQFDEIAGHVNSESVPTVLVGDMNCSPSSTFLANLIKDAKLRDSRKGFGIHPTWPSFAGLFAIPIDHVLITNTIHVHNRFVGNASGSDHRPVIVDVSIAAQEEE